MAKFKGFTIDEKREWFEELFLLILSSRLKKHGGFTQRDLIAESSSFAIDSLREMERVFVENEL